MNGLRSPRGTTLIGIVIAFIGCKGGAAPGAVDPIPEPIATARGTGPRATTPAATPCLDARRDFAARHGALEGEREIDLDATPPADLALAYDCGQRSGNCTFELFVLRDGCATPVGEVVGAPEPAGGAQRGMNDLRAVFCGTRCACGDYVVGTYRFDGARYVQTEQENCHCPTLPGAEESDCRRVPPGTSL